MNQNMKKKKPTFKLNNEEKRIEAEMERGLWVQTNSNDLKRVHSEFVNAAKNRTKDARVNLRLNPEDVLILRAKAESEGVPYQTLIGSVLHKYATGQLIDERAVEIVVQKFKKKLTG